MRVPGALHPVALEEMIVCGARLVLICLVRMMLIRQLVRQLIWQLVRRRLRLMLTLRLLLILLLVKRGLLVFQ